MGSESRARSNFVSSPGAEPSLTARLDDHGSDRSPCDRKNRLENGTIEQFAAESASARRPHGPPPLYKESRKSATERILRSLERNNDTRPYFQAVPSGALTPEFAPQRHALRCDPVQNSSGSSLRSSLWRDAGLSDSTSGKLPAREAHRIAGGNHPLHNRPETVRKEPCATTSGATARRNPSSQSTSRETAPRSGAASKLDRPCYRRRSHCR